MPGCAFDIGTFYQMAVWTADQTPFSAERVVDVELVEAGYHEKNVLYENIETLLLAVVNGEEEYMILSSKDGFLQFFGMNDKFLAETRSICRMETFARILLSIRKENKRWIRLQSTQCLTSPKFRHAK